MKRSISVLLVLIAACSAPSSSSYMRDAEPAHPPSEKESIVVIFRPASRDPHRFPALYDGVSLIGFAEPWSYFEYRCAPGHHLFMIHGVTDAAVEAELAPAKTYYLRCIPEIDLFTLRWRLVPVTKGSTLMENLDDELFECECREPDEDAIADYNDDEGGRDTAEELKGYFENEGKHECLQLRPEDGKGTE